MTVEIPDLDDNRSDRIISSLKTEQLNLAFLCELAYPSVTDDIAYNVLPKMAASDFVRWTPDPDIQTQSTAFGPLLADTPIIRSVPRS